MPTIPKSIVCESLRCKEPRVQGSAYCEAHGGKPKQTAARYEANREYKGAAWDSIRTGVLSREPLCMGCRTVGRITPAAHVDHVFPWRVMGGNAFRNNLFQALCAECHGVKSGLERTGVFRYYGNPAPVDYTAADYGAVTRAL
jgi:5-methylcytosine-specific restriction protein A